MKLKKQIEEYKPCNMQEEKDKEMAIKYIETFDNILTRENEFAHITSSAWLVNKERTKVLFAYHKQYNAWAWTGGHNDGEEDCLKTAIREAKEETGIQNVIPVSENIFSIEILTVSGHIKKGKYVSAHQHINITFLLETSEEEELKIKEDENTGVKWFNIDELLENVTEPEMITIYEKLINKVKEEETYG